MAPTYGAGRIFWIFPSWLSACPLPARNASQREAGGSRAQASPRQVGAGCAGMKAKTKTILMILFILSNLKYSA